MRLSTRKRSAVAASLASAALFVANGALAAPSSTSIEQGYDLGEIQHPRTVAMAGASQVFGGSTVAVFENPANLALYRTYHLEAIAAFSPEARRQSYGGAVVDSSTNRLAGGFGGTWSQMDPDGIDRKWTDLRLALAYPISDRFSIGATGRYFRASQAISRGPFGADPVSDGTPNSPLESALTFDAGAAVNVTDGIRVAITGKNLTAPNTGLLPTLLEGGIGYTNQTFTIEADGLVDFTTYQTPRGRGMAGLEYLIADRVPLRLGYRYDNGTQTHAISLGAGYVDKRFSIDLAGRHDVAGDHPSTMLSLGLRFFIDATGSGDSNQSADQL